MDVQHRRKAYLERKQHRKDMKQKEKERLARKEVELQTVKDANEDLDIEEWLEHWEAMEANHPVEIPAKESPDIDGDVIWEDE